MAPRSRVDPAPLVCIGRQRDQYGRPLPGHRGRPHLLVLPALEGESLAELEARARVAGWRLGPLPKHPGQARSVMCSECGSREQSGARLPPGPLFRDDEPLFDRAAS